MLRNILLCWILLALMGSCDHLNDIHRDLKELISIKRFR